MKNEMILHVNAASVALGFTQSEWEQLSDEKKDEIINEYLPLDYWVEVEE